MVPDAELPSRHRNFSRRYLAIVTAHTNAWQPSDWKKILMIEDGTVGELTPESFPKRLAQTQYRDNTTIFHTQATETLLRNPSPHFPAAIPNNGAVSIPNPDGTSDTAELWKKGNAPVEIPNGDGSTDTAELWKKGNAAVSIPNGDGTSDTAELWKKGNGAVEIPNTDGTSDVAELWKKGNGAVGIPNGDGSEDIAELW
ncbi:hypothetical protein EYC80_001169 [Monilinia laxa]|uniref:Uncharacterized protein n=2 Tax=Monilinia laxa TaxID=61186 RepID=A0A5N6K8G0_MONLA|nr:hypothetical protein EYC80_001169 [Monilinia laxa]